MVEVARLNDSITAVDTAGVTFRQRLLAAASWEHIDNPLGLQLMQLTLVGTRLKYQGFGLAHRLLAVLKDPDIMGQFDGIVVWAGVDARPWFERQGFTADRILNARYEKFLETWEDSTLMSYTMPAELPPTGFDAACPSAQGPENYVQLLHLDDSIAKWKDKMVDTYAEQLHLINSMRSEIGYLRGKVKQQDLVVEFLTAECARYRRERDEFEMLNARLRSQMLQTSAASDHPLRHSTSTPGSASTHREPGDSAHSSAATSADAARRQSGGTEAHVSVSLYTLPGVPVGV